MTIKPMNLPAGTLALSYPPSALKAAPAMQRLVLQLASQHQYDLSRGPSRLWLEMGGDAGALPLVIEQHESNLLSVSHYIDYDPQFSVLFFTGQEPWIPIAGPRGGYDFGGMDVINGEALPTSRSYALLSEDGTQIEWLEAPGQAQLAAFCENTWAPDLLKAGWLERGYQPS